MLKILNSRISKSKKSVKGTSKNNKSIRYTMIPFAYNGQEAMLKIKGEFGSFTYAKDGGNYLFHENESS